MNITVGLLHSSRTLIEWVCDRELSPKELLDNFRTIEVCPPHDVLNLCTRCGWIETNNQGNLTPTLRGHTLRSTAPFELRLREQMRDYVATEKPTWAKLLPRGRREAMQFVTRDVYQVFDEAELLSSPPHLDCIKWWDEIAGLVRSSIKSGLTEVGRRGEMLTIRFEQERTKREPFWQSVESNLSGFDILSVVSSENLEPLRIEVKASDEPFDVAQLFLSRNEWETAINSKSYVFHLWTLRGGVRLAVVPVDILANHLPIEKGEGKWESTSIPFRVYKDLFKVILL